MNQWADRASVMRNLSQVMGNLADDRLTFVRHKPPTRTEIEDNEEMKQLFGEDYELADVKTNQDDVDPADFGAIHAMLDSVRGFEETGPDNVKKLEKSSNSSDSDILLVSRLNPNVQEFLPKNSPNVFRNEENNNTEYDGSGDGRTLKLADTKLNSSDKDSIKADNAKEEITAEKADGDNLTVYIDKLSEEKTASLKKELQSHVNGDQAASSVYKQKFYRNVAIASLLKLHSTSNGSETQIKLMKPNDYLRSPSRSSSSAEKADDVVYKDVAIVDAIKDKTDAQPEPKKDEDPAVVERLCQPTDAELKESIGKVNGWFDSTSSLKSKTSNNISSPVKSSSPSLSISGSMFKQTIQSPVVDSVSQPKSCSSTPTPSPSSPVIKKFQPSQKRDQIYAKYKKAQEEALRRERMKTDTVWTIAERKMRDKEEEERKLKQKNTTLEG